jgi:ATP-binding cassette subfamily F protein uup
LLRIISGEYEPDSGSVALCRSCRVSFLSQRPPTAFPGTALEYCDHSLEAEKILTRLGIPFEASFNSLSGGEARRVMLARTLSREAELYALDEPTNHLDLEAIVWLEDYLLRSVKTMIFVTHDRAFARSVANRVGELDRGSLYTLDLGFDDFMASRAASLETEEAQQAAFDKRLAEEEAWLRRGVKARRTRNEGRVRALEKMREEYRARRERAGNARVTVVEAERSGKLVVEAIDLSFSYPGSESRLITGLTTTILRGDKVGIVGPNGAGKTTLIRLLLGELEADGGRVRLGEKLAPIYLDQMRDSLDDQKTVIENLSGGDDMIVVGGKQRHVRSYLADFLFSPDRLRSPVGTLSGGERNRLLLAKLFARPSNLLILDEPTNDLDLETLELLEDLLVSYEGTVLLVSHDREFLDNVVTDCLVFTAEGGIEESAGGYSDWLRRRESAAPAAEAKSSKSRGEVRAQASGRSNRARKLSYNEKRELERLPDRITQTEAEIRAIETELADPELYKSGGERVSSLSESLEQKKADLEAEYRRWEELDEVSSGT